MKVHAANFAPPIPEPGTHGQDPVQAKLTDLPDGVLETVFCQLDEASRGHAARVCKRFSELMPAARRSAPLPSRLELLGMGCPSPDCAKILASFARRAPGNLQESKGLRRHYEKGASLQKAVNNGTAASFFVDGRIYTGAAKNGVPQNFGRNELERGRYEGEYKDGEMHGWGFFVGADGSRYEGELREGELHGRGVHVWANGDRYEGEFRDGEPHGRGVFVWANGDRYDGEHKNGKMDGQGVFVGTDGGRYEGGHRDDKQHGRGIFVATDGSRYEGEYKDGKPHGRCILTGTDGSQRVVMYENGRRLEDGADGAVSLSQDQQKPFAAGDCR